MIALAKLGKNVFYFTSKALFENKILELYIFKFHDVIKYQSMKQEVHFIK